jgi:hypothetical protein
MCDGCQLLAQIGLENFIWLFRSSQTIFDTFNFITLRMTLVSFRQFWLRHLFCLYRFNIVLLMFDLTGLLVNQLVMQLLITITYFIVVSNVYILSDVLLIRYSSSYDHFIRKSLLYFLVFVDMKAYRCINYTLDLSSLRWRLCFIIYY